MQRIFIPVKESRFGQWVLIEVIIEDKIFKVYSGSDEVDIEGLQNSVLRWLEEVVYDKTDFDGSKWTLNIVGNLPRYENRIDSGVYTVIFADLASMHLPFMFGDGCIPHFKKSFTSFIFRGYWRS